MRVALSARLRHRALARRRRALESGEVDEEKGERPFVCARQAGDGDARPSPQSVVQRAPPPLRRPQKVLDVQRRPRVPGANADPRHAARQALQQRGQ